MGGIDHPGGNKNDEGQDDDTNFVDHIVNEFNDNSKNNINSWKITD